MADRPVIFSAAMIRALLAGTKTQTRRVLPEISAKSAGVPGVTDAARFRSPWVRLRPGDRLWCREAWAKVGDAPDDIHACPDLRVHAYYRADSVVPEQQRWRPSIHMPRWASRLTLTVTDVRVERLQDIREADAMAEGVTQMAPPDPRDGSRHFGVIGVPGIDRLTAQKAFRDLWNSINGPGSWDANPWVAAIGFTVTKGNIDQPPTRSLDVPLVGNCGGYDG